MCVCVLCVCSELQMICRYVNIFSAIDLKRHFYFSYTYDLTHTFQHNMTHPPPARGFKSNNMYVWNDFLIKNGFPDKPETDWCVQLVHGFLDQSSEQTPSPIFPLRQLQPFLLDFRNQCVRKSSVFDLDCSPVKILCGGSVLEEGCELERSRCQRCGIRTDRD